MVHLVKKRWIFPWQTVRHNQMVRATAGIHSLVGGLKHLDYFPFHMLGMSSFPLTNTIIFQDGRYTTNQIYYSLDQVLITNHHYSSLLTMVKLHHQPDPNPFTDLWNAAWKMGTPFWRVTVDRPTGDPRSNHDAKHFSLLGAPKEELTLVSLNNSNISMSMVRISSYIYS